MSSATDLDDDDDVDDGVRLHVHGMMSPGSVLCH